MVTWPSRKLKSGAHVEKFTDSKNAILFDLWRKVTKLSRKNRFRTVASPGRLAVLNDARRQYILLVFYRSVAANCRYCFYSQAKNQVFRTAGATRYTDSGQTVQDRRAPGSAWLCEISCQSVQMAGNAAPKISKISTFWVKSRSVTPLTDFQNF